MRIAINGFGRIGRLVFRHAIKDPDIDVAFINDVASIETLSYLLKYDSVHGTLNERIHCDDDFIFVGNKQYQVCSYKNPKDIPYKEFSVDCVIESTGKFTNGELAYQHIIGGADKVIITAPSDVPMFVMGVNQHYYDSTVQHVISNASCTTNCLAPIAKVLHENFEIVEGLMSTIHATTTTQTAVDATRSKDLRYSRSCMLNIIPTSTGAAKAVGKIIPELDGKLTGSAYRVPVANVSLIDLTVRLKKSTSYDEICLKMKEASEGELKGILGYTDAPVVSTDFNGCELSSVFDEKCGIELNSNFFKIVAWYDNEFGYSKRVIDLARYIVAT